MEIRYFKIALILIFSFAFFSCGSKTQDSKVEDAISEVISKFPQLPKLKSNLANYYQFVRSVKNGYNNFEIQLRSEPDSVEDPQQILILINKQGKCKALPFFSNTYRDYWSFPFDTLMPGIERVHSTFEKEFITALDYLNLNDSNNTASIVIDEMIYSLLRCKKIEKQDSAELKILHMRSNRDIPEENYERAKERLKKNFELVSKKWDSEETIVGPFALFWDKMNGRIYQFKGNGGFKRKLDLSINAYRHDYTYHYVSHH